MQRKKGCMNNIHGIEEGVETGVISARITKNQIDFLDESAKSLGKNRSQLVREIIDYFMLRMLNKN